MKQRRTPLALCPAFDFDAQSSLRYGKREVNAIHEESLCAIGLFTRWSNRIQSSPVTGSSSQSFNDKVVTPIGLSLVNGLPKTGKTMIAVLQALTAVSLDHKAILCANGFGCMQS